jgi:pilus assembly protein CpaB
MRGVSLTINAAAAAGGYVVPNDRVDVVLTRGTAAGQVSRTIARNARVLAIDTRLGELGTTGAPADPDNPRAEIFSGTAIAILELDPAQAEIVVNSIRLGELSLVLRAMSDFTDQSDDSAAANQAIRMTSPFWTGMNGPQ